VRLIPDDPDNDSSEKAAIKAFFNHRLPKERTTARQEWLETVEAEHALWTNISTAKKELIRSILNLVAFEVVKRRRPSSSFDFSGASIGNLFLTGYVRLSFFSYDSMYRAPCILHSHHLSPVDYLLEQRLISDLTANLVHVSLQDRSNQQSTSCLVSALCLATHQSCQPSTPTSHITSPWV
jgi:hypothetical protein